MDTVFPHFQSSELFSRLRCDKRRLIRDYDDYNHHSLYVKWPETRIP